MMTKSAHPRLALALAALAMLLGACGEKPQTAGTRSADTPAWNGAAKAFTAPGWKPGDKASWEEQIRQRNRNQNDYVRITP